VDESSGCCSFLACDLIEKATAQAESNSFRTLRARVTFAARHPWPPPFGPSLRDVKNFSRKFFVLAKVTKTVVAGASRHGCAAPVPCASRPARHAAPTRFAQTRGSSAAWPTCDARLALGANSESKSKSKSKSKQEQRRKRQPIVSRERVKNLVFRRLLPAHTHGKERR